MRIHDLTYLKFKDIIDEWFTFSFFLTDKNKINKKKTLKDCFNLFTFSYIMTNKVRIEKSHIFNNQNLRLMKKILLI